MRRHSLPEVKKEVLDLDSDNKDKVINLYEITYKVRTFTLKVPIRLTRQNKYDLKIQASRNSKAVERYQEDVYTNLIQM